MGACRTLCRRAAEFRLHVLELGEEARELGVDGEERLAEAGGVMSGDGELLAEVEHLAAQALRLAQREVTEERRGGFHGPPNRR